MITYFPIDNAIVSEHKSSDDLAFYIDCWVSAYPSIGLQYNLNKNQIYDRAKDNLDTLFNKEVKGSSLRLTLAKY